ncbi:MAG TPA: twin-arginine translocase TatA/TatE family subunit [Gemmatimonadales bacterium]|nr:twin-arginine translocase TatA/TatE family subunit [Gemmatimonadales bacterium]
MSFGEIVVLAGAALLAFGAEGLPEVGRKVGLALRAMRRGMNEVRDEIEGLGAEPRGPAPRAPRRLVD